MRKLLRSTAAVAASLALGAGLAIGGGGIGTTTADAASCQRLSSYPTVKKGSKGNATKAAECLLRSAGETPSRNGSFSSHDVKQTKDFQKRVGLKASGTVDQRTWTALTSRGSRKALAYGSRGNDVKRLQSALTASGRSVPATGWYGPMTRTAVKSLQKSLGHRQTGKVTDSTWKALQAGRGVAAKPAAKAAPKKKSTSSSSKAGKAVAFAKAQLGDAYRYGGTGPSSWDCSGLTQGSWKSAGVKLPRTTTAQYKAGKKVSKSSLKPGDVVFFYSGRSHAGIYVGDGYVIHASRPGKPVAKIKMSYMPYNGAIRPA